MVLFRLMQRVGGSLAILAFAISLTLPGYGGETWDGGGTNNEWSTGANWNTVLGRQIPPPNDGTADIVMAGTTRLTPRVDVDWDVNSLMFNSTAGGFSLSGDPGVSLGIGAGGVTNNDAQLQILLLPIGLNASQIWNASAGPLSIGNTIAGHFLLPRTLTLAGANNFQIVGAITNATSVSKTGTGTLTFNGLNTNSYNGSTMVSAGTLVLDRTGGPNRAIPGSLTIGDGAGGAGADVVRLDAADQITEAAGRIVTINSSGLLNLNGFNEALANLTINGGSISGASTLTVNEALTFTGGGSISAATIAAAASPAIVDSGLLNISSGGHLSNTIGQIGSTAGSNGQVTVSGAGAIWTNSAELYVGNAGVGTLVVSNSGEVESNGNLYVGNAGSGTINITSGGQLSNDVGYIGDDAGSVGDVTVDGAGSTWTNSGDLYVGNAGNGTLNISNEGSVSSAFDTTAYIGSQPGSIGEVTVATSSHWFLLDNAILYAGYSGDGTLEIVDEGIVDCDDVGIGLLAGSTGLVRVDGPSNMYRQGVMIVGSFGDGTLEITNGGRVIFDGLGSEETYVGRWVDSIGHVRVDGTNSWLHSGNDLYLGYDGQGILEITGGGKVTAANVKVGGSNFVFDLGTGSVNVDGSASVLQSLSVIIGLYGSGTVTLSNGGSITSSLIAVGQNGELVGDGYITSAVQSNVGGSIRGNLSIVGDLQNNGLLSPGASPGMISADGNYSQAASGELLIELTSASSYDQLLITDVATLDGRLTVNLLDGFVPSVGQSFTFLTADDVDGAFGSEMLPSIPGLIFDVIYNPNSVVLTVLPAFTADFDDDGDVDGDDVTQWQGDFGVNVLSDADDDGDSDGADFLAWQQQVGSGVMAGVAAAGVPEPAAGLLALVGVFARVRRRGSIA